MARPRTEEMPRIFENEWDGGRVGAQVAKRPRQFFNGLLADG